MSAATNGRARECWVPVPEAPDYLVSSHGRIWSTRSRKMLARNPHPQSGHIYVRMYGTKGVRLTFKVHRLVAKAFIGPAPSPFHEVCHNDGDPKNNRVENLRWDTRSANVRDQVRHGMHVQARKTHCPQGHAYNEINTYVNRQGKRECRTCHRESTARRRAAKRAAA